MKRMKTRVWEFICSEDGPTAVEYAFMLALIIVVCIASIGAVGQSTVELFDEITTSDALTGAGP